MNEVLLVEEIKSCVEELNEGLAEAHRAGISVKFNLRFNYLDGAVSSLDPFIYKKIGLYKGE